MDNKERIIVYPFDIEFSPILRHRELLKDYEIVGLVSPNGWGLSGKDAGCTDGGRDVGIIVGSSFDGALEACDAVLFTESCDRLDFNKLIYPKIVKAVEAGKNVIYNASLEKEEYDNVVGICEKKGVSFKYSNLMGKNVMPIDTVLEELYDIDIPIVFVLGSSDRTSKFEIQLSLRCEMKKMGYNVSQVGSRSNCEMLGFHSFPEFMLNSSISEIKKIVLFNRFIKKIETEEAADVIIIGIPGGVMPISSKFTNNFGIFAYEVSQAVSPDAVVFSSVYEDFLPEYFEKISTSLRYRLGYEIDCFNFSNKKIDWNSSLESNIIQFMTLDSEFIDRKIENLKTRVSIPIYNVLNGQDGLNMASCIVDKLGGYSEVEVV